MEKKEKPDKPNFGYKVHPSADRYPLMWEDELQELAEDIAENGLHDPIVLDKNNLLIDGRNRILACKIASVKPSTELFEGTEAAVIAFIHSKNDHRRHMSQGQKAMALAFDYPDAVKGRPTKGNENVRSPNITGERLSKARAVLRHSVAKAKEVLQGTKSLDKALQEVEDDKEKSRTDEYKLNLLRERAPDLADLYEEGKLKSVDEGLAAAEERRKALDHQRETAHRQIVLMVEGLKDFFHEDLLETIELIKGDTKFRANLVDDLGNVKVADLKKGAENLLNIVQEVRKVTREK